ncbi:flavodoxin domain-containing protein [Oscillibacter sp.]|uniref:flavodoxin domain-containing protein n=1 Tax=Oscillibacter sp. TaxID=1945593 RepID=UPI0033908088
MKAAIIYASTHHGNTKKLVDAIAGKYPVTVFDAQTVPAADLTGYDLIGFASGIAWGKFYESVERFAQASLPEGKQIFFLYTCADNSRDFAASLRAVAAERGAEDLGTYACKGFNSYGPWKLVGGINKKHPTADEIQRAVDFFAALVRKISSSSKDGKSAI